MHACRKDTLLHVTGSWAWILLAAEAGLHRYKNVEARDDDVHLRVLAAIRGDRGGAASRL